MWHELPSRCVVLGHEGDRELLLRGDLLGARLVDRVLVGDPQRRPVVEVDLVLAVVALALGALHRQARRAHLVADLAQQRLHARPAEHRVVVVVEVGRLEAAVALLGRLLVGVLEDDELELGAGEGLQPALGQALQLRAQDLARRGDDRRAVGPAQVGEAERRSLVPGDHPQRLEVRAASRSRRSRAPTRTSRSRRRCSSRRRRPAGSCRPRRRARRRSSRKWAAVSRFPCRRPCMSVSASRTVSTVFACTALRS